MLTCVTGDTSAPEENQKKLRCILGDGSVFEDDFSKLMNTSELIKIMLDMDDLVTVDTVHLNYEVPLPLIPNHQRMKNVVENTKGLPLIDLIYQINDADYLNCQKVIDSCSDELVEIIENSNEEILEAIVEYTIPTVLSVVLLRVNCIQIIKNCMIDTNPFPLPYHLHVVMTGCGILQSEHYLKFSSVCKIMLYCVNVKPSEKSKDYVNEYISAVKDILNGRISDHKRFAAIVGAIINDVSLVKFGCGERGFMEVAGEMGRVEIIELFLKEKITFSIQSLATIAFNSACYAGLTYLPKQLMERFNMDRFLIHLNPQALLFLLKENYNFEQSHLLLPYYINPVIRKAVEGDDVEFFRVVSQRDDFKEILKSRSDEVCMMSRCTNYEIMKILHEGYNDDYYTLENLSHDVRWLSPITRKKYNSIFGIIESEYTKRPWRILREVLLDKEEDD